MTSSDDPSRREGRYDRRELLRRAGAAGVAVGAAGSGFGQAFYGPLRFKGRWLKGDLSLITWAHFVPSFDTWFDKTWAVQWGQRNDVEVKIDHILNTLLTARAQAEAAAKNGHDIFFDLAPSPQGASHIGRRTTRRRRSTSRSRTTTSPTPWSGGTTSGTASDCRRTRGTAFGGRLRS